MLSNRDSNENAKLRKSSTNAIVKDNEISSLHNNLNNGLISNTLHDQLIQKAQAAELDKDNYYVGKFFLNINILLRLKINRDEKIITFIDRLISQVVEGQRDIDKNLISFLDNSIDTIKRLNEIPANESRNKIIDALSNLDNDVNLEKLNCYAKNIAIILIKHPAYTKLIADNINDIFSILSEFSIKNTNAFFGQLDKILISLSQLPKHDENKFEETVIKFIANLEKIIPKENRIAIKDIVWRRGYASKFSTDDNEYYNHETYFLYNLELLNKTIQEGKNNANCLYHVEKFLGCLNIFINSLSTNKEELHFAIEAGLGRISDLSEGCYYNILNTWAQDPNIKKYINIATLEKKIDSVLKNRYPNTEAKDKENLKGQIQRLLANANNEQDEAKQNIIYEIGCGAFNTLFSIRKSETVHNLTTYLKTVNEVLEANTSDENYTQKLLHLNEAVNHSTQLGKHYQQISYGMSALLYLAIPLLYITTILTITVVLSSFVFIFLIGDIYDKFKNCDRFLFAWLESEKKMRGGITKNNTLAGISDLHKHLTEKPNFPINQSTHHFWFRDKRFKCENLKQVQAPSLTN